MPRVLFECRGVPVYAYPGMLSLGVVLGTIGANYVAHDSGMASLRVHAAILLLIAPALIGARLLHVVSYWPIYRREPTRIWRRSDSGAALYGGLLVALAISVPLLRLLELPFWAFWDVATFTMLIGMIVTKMGCLLNGCCAGRPMAGRRLTRFGIRLPSRFPSQIAESLWALLLLIGISAIRRYHPVDGALFLVAAAGYALGRALLERTRETIDRIGGVSVHVAISAALVVLSLVTLLARWASAGMS